MDCVLRLGALVVVAVAAVVVVVAAVVEAGNVLDRTDHLVVVECFGCDWQEGFRF